MPCKVSAAELGQLIALPKLQCCALHAGCVFWRPLYGTCNFQAPRCCSQTCIIRLPAAGNNTHHPCLTLWLVSLCNRRNVSCRYIGGQPAEHACSQAGGSP